MQIWTRRERENAGKLSEASQSSVFREEHGRYPRLAVNGHEPTTWQFHLYLCISSVHGTVAVQPHRARREGLPALQEDYKTGCIYVALELGGVQQW